MTQIFKPEYALQISHHVINESSGLPLRIKKRAKICKRTHTITMIRVAQQLKNTVAATSMTILWISAANRISASLLLSNRKAMTWPSLQTTNNQTPNQNIKLKCQDPRHARKWNHRPSKSHLREQSISERPKSLINIGSQNRNHPHLWRRRQSRRRQKPQSKRQSFKLKRKNWPINQ